MRFASSLFVGVALLLVASVGLTTLRQRGAGDAGPGHASVLLAAGNEVSVRRLQAKSAVSQKLIDGEISLWEAAAWFRDISRATATTDDAAAPEDAGKPEAERFCRQAIRWAGATAHTISAERSEEVVALLQAQLDERLRRDGEVALPEAP